MTEPRKTRQLSRYGCRTCKQRKVKCDEAKPSCHRCKASGVPCSFQANQVVRPCTSDKVAIPRLRASPTNAIWSQNTTSCFHLDHTDQQLLLHFRKHTLASLGSETVFVYEKQLFADAFSCPALMHGILALSAAHTNHLSPQSSPKLTQKQTLHCFMSISLFTQWINHIPDADKDAIWATAVALTTLAFTSTHSTHTTNSQTAWPLTSHHHDLQWLRLKAQDKILWQIIDPMRVNSVFHFMADQLSSVASRPSRVGIQDMPKSLIQLYDLDESSSEDTNVYFSFIQALVPLLTCTNTSSFYHAFGAIASMSDQLRGRIEQKDIKGLGLLYLWYHLIHGRKWWVDQRTSLEIPALRVYLGSYSQHLVSTLDALLVPSTPTEVAIVQ